MLGVNESSLKGYPHASISSCSAFERTLQKIIRNNTTGFKILFLHVQVPDEDGVFKAPSKSCEKWVTASDIGMIVWSLKTWKQCGWILLSTRNGYLLGETKGKRVHMARDPDRQPYLTDTEMKVHGELDTKTGGPSFFAAIIRSFYPELSASTGIRSFYPELSASTGIGIQYDKHHDGPKYCLRGKKAFPISSNGLLSFNIKGRVEYDKEFKKKNARAAAELSWGILNFQRDQDIQLKLGYDVSDNVVPYLKLRENNWSLTADLNGRWNIRFDL